MCSRDVALVVVVLALALSGCTRATTLKPPVEENSASPPWPADTPYTFDAAPTPVEAPVNVEAPVGVELPAGVAPPPSVRSRQILITQIQGLEALLRATPARDPMRRRALQSLHDRYEQLAEVARRDRDEARHLALESGPQDPQGAREAAQRAEKIRVAALGMAAQMNERLRAEVGAR
jgi:hypothetical protein